MKYNFIYNIVEQYLNENILEFKICSRLIWKNWVFYCKTDNREYAIKVFCPKEEIRDRYRIEHYMLEKFEKIFNIKTPKLLYELQYNKYKILIMEWINGKSIKKCINEKGLTNENLKLIEDYIEKLEKVWQYNYKETKIKEILNINNCKDKKSISTIDRRIYKDKGDVFDFCIKNTSIPVKKIIHSYYNILEKNKMETKNIINSDISLHEVILKDKEQYWIDFENYTFGDINNDLAGIFYSISNSIYYNRDDVNKLFNVISKNNHYNKELFIFYLIERVFCAYYIDYKNINIEEFEFYIKFLNYTIMKLEKN